LEQSASAITSAKAESNWTIDGHYFRVNVLTGFMIYRVT